MLSKDDFLNISAILEKANSKIIDFDCFKVGKDFLIEKNKPEMAEGLQWLIDNKKHPLKSHNWFVWSFKHDSNPNGIKKFREFVFLHNYQNQWFFVNPLQQLLNFFSCMRKI